MGLGQVWPKDGEDDVLEGLKGVVCMHFHSRSNVAEGFGFCDPRIKPGWHTIASNWEPGSVTWYYDGVEVDRTTRGVTSAPMYLVLLNSVSLKAPRVSRPSSLRVAYVRVWQHPGPRKKRK
jgi:beta-glucanase (GH16 family)